MAYEPLSPTTQKTRKSLLAFSTAYFLLNLYNVKINAGSLTGLDFDFSDQLLLSFLILGMIYLAISFVIYAIDGINNKKMRKYEVDFSNEVGKFDRKIEELSRHLFSVANLKIGSDKIEIMQQSIKKIVLDNTATDSHIKISSDALDLMDFLNKRYSENHDEINTDEITKFILGQGSIYTEAVKNKNPKWDIITANFRYTLDIILPIPLFLISIFSPLYICWLQKLFL